jgi:hypothetical protein
MRKESGERGTIKSRNYSKPHNLNTTMKYFKLTSLLSLCLILPSCGSDNGRYVTTISDEYSALIITITDTHTGDTKVFSHKGILMNIDYSEEKVDLHQQEKEKVGEH